MGEFSLPRGCALGLLPQVVAGYEQDAGQKYPSGRGAHAFVEFAPEEQGH